VFPVARPASYHRAVTIHQLIDWTRDAVDRLSAKGDVTKLVAERTEISERGAEWKNKDDWYALAKKLARALGELPPDEPVKKLRTPKKSVERKPRQREQKRENRKARRRLEDPKPGPYEVNEQVRRAFDAVETGRKIIFVTGGAGTGKSAFIRELRARYPKRNSVVLAPTGVAALNAGGQTIHSFCGLPLRPFVPGDAAVNEEMKDVLDALDLLIIDEISMVRADTLDGVDEFLRVNRKSDLPFGGVQVVFVGDLFQLPPVVTPNDRPILSQHYESFGFDAARCLRGLSFRPVVLDKVYRQSDPAFAALLARIRDGRDVSRAVAEINAQCAGRELQGQYLTLTPRRDAAARENEQRLAALPGQPMVFEAERSGSFKRAADERLPAPAQLLLKRNAQVMFVRNDAERRWVNGTLGTVTRLSSERVSVRLEDGSEHDVDPIEWQDVEYAFDPKEKRIVSEVAGTFTQLPLMLAWAVTIHKAQGLTLNRVLVDLDRGAFAEGHVYVALSRCRTIEGLALRRPIRAGEVRCSASAQAFYAKMSRR
jgi:hypothetical protein